MSCMIMNPDIYVIKVFYEEKKNEELHIVNCKLSIIFLTLGYIPAQFLSEVFVGVV